MNTRILLAALPLAALFAACGDPSGPGETPPAHENRVALSYSGGVAGTFTAEGEYVPGTVPNRQTFAVANLAGGTLKVTAYSQNGTSSFSVASVTVPRAAVGEVQVDRFCGADECPEVTLGLELGHATGSVARQTCRLDQGTIRISAISSTRAKGAVSGTGICLPGDGGESAAFTVTSGTFEVDIRQG